MLTLQEDKVKQHGKTFSSSLVYLFHKLSSISRWVAASKKFRRRVSKSMAVEEKYIEKGLLVMTFLKG